jgi:hypothetical protein
MGILSTFKGRFSAQTPAPEAVEPVELVSASAAISDNRVHHEYFVADEPDASGKWTWLARVYASNGAANEGSGSADSRDLSRNAALTWCARVKASLGAEA